MHSMQDGMLFIMVQHHGRASMVCTALLSMVQPLPSKIEARCVLVVVLQM